MGFLWRLLVDVMSSIAVNRGRGKKDDCRNDGWKDFLSCSMAFQKEKGVPIILTEVLSHRFPFCKPVNQKLVNTLFSFQSEAMLVKAPKNGNRRSTAITLENWSKWEVRAVIRFLHAQGNTSTWIDKELATLMVAISTWESDIRCVSGEMCSMPGG